MDSPQLRLQVPNMSQLKPWVTYAATGVDNRFCFIEGESLIISSLKDNCTYFLEILVFSLTVVLLRKGKLRHLPSIC